MGESREEQQRACTSGAFPPVAERARLPEHIPALAQEADWSPKPANKRMDLYIEEVARSSPERVPGAMRRRRLGQRPDSKIESDAPATVSADGRLVAVAFDRAIESFYSLGLEAKGHLAPVSRVFPSKCCLSERAAEARSACLFSFALQPSTIVVALISPEVPYGLEGSRRQGEAGLKVSFPPIFDPPPAISGPCPTVCQQGYRCLPRPYKGLKGTDSPTKVPLGKARHSVERVCGVKQGVTRGRLGAGVSNCIKVVGSWKRGQSQKSRNNVFLGFVS